MTRVSRSRRTAGAAMDATFRGRRLSDNAPRLFAARYRPRNDSLNFPAALGASLWDRAW